MSLTKEDLKQIEIILDKKLSAQTKELKAFAEEQTEELARMITTSVVIPMNHNFQIIADRLHISNEMVFEKPIKKYRTK